ncbi:MAG: ImmA/IrrE family metallo-endopeptidase, partial [Rhodobacteraceae bacterium]|nr:ImmA/IrrE family metallo-endopeptidase [Paracoccaceae bacterium]
MAGQKLYAGAKLRELRLRFDQTQRSFAQRLGISLPYLNQMENNNRPVSTTVLLALAQEFGLDVTEMRAGDEARLASDMNEALADPVFAGAPPPMADLRLTASNAPALARAFLALHAAYRQTHERLASLDEALGREEARLQPSAWEEVRDFFHYCDNYVDQIDRAAEQQSGTGMSSPAQAAAALEAHGIVIHIENSRSAPLRHYDVASKTLHLSAHAPPETRSFQLLAQLALLSQNELMEEILSKARFATSQAHSIAKIGLANYYAGAAMMPYAQMLDAAQECRHDLERLADKFGASLEQVAHRLSTLQRSGARGIPFFFVRV